MNADDIFTFLSLQIHTMQYPVGVILGVSVYKYLEAYNRIIIDGYRRRRYIFGLPITIDYDNEYLVSVFESKHTKTFAPTLKK